MSPGVLSFLGSVIVAAFTLIGVLVSNNKAQVVTETKLEELTREVREHNNFAKRMPVVEEKIDNLDYRVKALEKKGA